MRASFASGKTLNSNPELFDFRRQRDTMVSSSRVILSVIPAILAISFLADAVSAFAQESPGNYIINRVVIWDLFYRLMVIAFTVGAVVMGVLTYIIFRFRESNKKNIPRGRVESQR